MRYLSVCSGIESATVAWRDLGFEAAAFSEIEKFPRELLQHHYPNTPLHGDFTTIGERCFGFPDNYTNIPGASNAKRYAALGNSMAVPVMKWIGQRIQLIDRLSK